MKNAQREQIWDKIAGPWDIIIIGGGIVGAGLLREASQAGLRALLVEAHDFASGTSSRSSKMVHGGLRYLSTGQVKLTMESVHERQRLLQEGRGLIDPLEFLLVSYKGDRPPAWIFAVGLMVYDTLAMRWQHQHKSADELEMLCPQLPRCRPELRCPKERGVAGPEPLLWRPPSGRPAGSAPASSPARR